MNYITSMTSMMSEYFNQPAYQASQNVDSSEYLQPEKQRQISEDRQTGYQTQRSAEASKQMVFEVFNNTIAILEELESREYLQENEKTRLKKSNIAIPDQSYKSDDDIRTILQTQILILQTQMKTCLPEILPDVTDVLIEKTVKWLACRERLHLKKSDIDYFSGQIFNVLSDTKVKHPEQFYQSPVAVKDVNFEDMQKIIQQQAHVTVIDTKYGEGGKRAVPPATREDDVKIGIDRLTEGNPKRRMKLPDILYDSENKTEGIEDTSTMPETESKTSTGCCFPKHKSTSNGRQKVNRKEKKK